jgi:MurNAc alpha-1-phosphate uridylyltransferase
MTELCAVVLAAGEGRRLRPLTEVHPKALCPVGNVPLLDRALALVRDLGFTDNIAVNASYLAEQVVAHIDGRVHLSVEPGGPLGTSGGVGRLRDWIGGRAVLVVNADAYLAGAPVRLLDGWDGTTVRLLGVPAGARPPEFGHHRFAGMSVLPWKLVAPLRPEPADLVRTVWRPAEAAGHLDVIDFAGRYLDTGTPAGYLAANLDAAGAGNLVAPGATVTGRLDHAVVGAGARVDGRITRGVVWPGGVVGHAEDLVDAIRVGRDLTVPARG